MKIICEIFNDFFINVGSSLSKTILPQNFILGNYIKRKAVYSLYLEPVTGNLSKVCSTRILELSKFNFATVHAIYIHPFNIFIWFVLQGVFRD